MTPRSGADTCDSCGTEIVWARNEDTGSWMPLERDPDGDWTVARSPAQDLSAIYAPDEGNYVSHFATCPQSDAWRGGGGND